MDVYNVRDVVLTMSDDISFSRVAELIGEMAWGIDLPNPVKITYCDLSGGIKNIDLPPKNMEPIFEAIYQKLKIRKEYQPFLQQKEKIKELEQEIDRLNTFNSELQVQNNLFSEEIDRLKASESSVKAEGIREAAGKVIYLNDDVMGLLEVGGNKKPDNYRAEGWWQAYQALMQYASTLNPVNSDTDRGDDK